jgi:prepilin-type N-terminal cleavage/methylation domain-containing protein
MRADRPGMTLVELVVALALTGVVMTMTVGMSFVSIAHADRLGSRLSEHESTALGERTLARLLMSGAAPRGDSSRIVGSSEFFQFDAVCPSAAGVGTPCRATVSLVDRDSAHDELVATWGAGSRLALMTLPKGASFTFLSYEGGVASWHRGWGANLRAPGALGIAIQADTLVFRFGVP